MRSHPRKVPVNRKEKLLELFPLNREAHISAVYHEDTQRLLLELPIKLDIIGVVLVLQAYSI